MSVLLGFSLSFSLNLSDAEIPKLLGNQLLIARAPSTAANVMLFRNGLLMTIAFNDYSIDGKTITPNPPPDPGDKFVVYYRY